MDRTKASLRAIVAPAPEVVPSAAPVAVPVLFLLALIALSIWAGLILAGRPLWAAELKPGSGAAAAGAREAGPSSAREVSDGGPGVFDGPHFSSPPTDPEILVSGVLPQPLAPVGGAPEAAENRALGAALYEYQGRLRHGQPDDAVAPLTDFLRGYPASRWCAALYLNLGIIYRQTGHMSRAWDAWERAWDLSRHATQPGARAIADYSVGELAEFEAYLGRIETLAPLLAEVKGRPMHGTGAANVSKASQGLAEMRTRPQDAFRCGPMALHRICLLQGRTDGVLKLEQSRSTIRGTSLLQVAELAHQIGLDYRIAVREPGAPIIVPAVMHWKVGHFAAITKRSGGRYQLEDPTFGENILVSRATVDDEASGYFLVPAGNLPRGWRPASPQEGARVWGRGFTSSQAGATPYPVLACPNCAGSGMTTVNAQASTVSLTLRDAPLSYQTPRGPPVDFELDYSHRDATQPAIFTYINFGPKWTSNWISYIDNNASSTNSADLYAPGGGLESYHPSGDLTPSGGIIFVAGADDQALVTSTVSSGVTTGFIRELPDGTSQTFARRFGTKRYFLSSVADPQGNRVILTYDSNTRITTITDAVGEKTTLTYGLASDPFKVTKVTDPFGRSATLTYNSDGELASVTDTLGITSSYTYLYASGDFVKTLTTPYGTSTFTYGDATTDYRLGTTIFLTMTDPLGQTQRVEFRQQAPGIADSDPLSLVPVGMPTNNQFLSFRDTFVWSPHQLALATLPDGEYDYTKAKMLHFLHAANFSQTSGVLESVKQPLENRVWFSYPNSGLSVGSSNLPSAIGRVLDNGATQLVTFQRNQRGLITQFTDPIGRQRTVTYASNDIDPLTVSNTTAGSNQLLVKATYDSHHQPLTVTDAAGQVTKYTFNTTGELTSVTDALNNTTSYAYGSTGLLLSITQPFPNAVTKIVYDSFNRSSSVTDSLGYQLQLSYDKGDRPTVIRYPDSTTTQFVYQLLNLVSLTDRLNHSTTFSYDALGRNTQQTDALGRTIKLAYCDCGAVSKITDPNGNASNLVYDLEERPLGKFYPDGTRIALTYEQTTSRVRGVTDALGQTTVFAYNLDDTIRSEAYSNALVATPGVSFVWDPGFIRLLSMIDGSGRTTYAYNPITNPPALGAGFLSKVTGPRGDFETSSYDALGRQINSTIDGATSQTIYDSLGRAQSHTNPLDTFKFTYLGASDLITAIVSTKGPSSLFSYLPNTGDQRLKSIINKTHAGTLISSFQYTYDAVGDVAAILQQQVGGAISRSMKYDAARQLIGMTAVGGGSNFAFSYDPAGNRISETAGTTTTKFTYNNVNAQMSPTPASYDKDGQPLALSSPTYRWDGAGRLISVTTGANTTTFAYDGIGRRIRITNRSGSTLVSDRFYFWCGDEPCVERDAASNAITKRYFAQGVQLNGQGLYYALDNLGSVRELINSSGAVTTHFDYDPYGVRRVLAGSVNSDFGFAGLFHESSSGLDLALYRSYDARRRRWLNRDPMGDGAGLNLYTYAANNPFTLLDPSGLWSWDSAWGFGASVAEGIVAGAVTAFVGAGVAAITPAWAAGTVAAGATLAAGYGLLNLARAIRSAWTGCENGRALDDYQRGERLGQSFLGVATAGIFLRTLNAFNGASRDLFNLRTKGFFARLAADSQANTVASSVYNSGRAVTWRDWAIFRPRSWFAKGDDATYRATVKTGGTLLGRLGAIFFFGGSQSGNDPASLGRPSRVAY